MKTDDLISALTADLPTKTMPVPRAVTTALLVSTPLMLAILFVFVHPRPGIEGMLLEPRILLKFVFSLGLFAAALWLALRVSRPGVGAGPARFGLIAAFAVLAIAVGVELATLPAAHWRSAMVGNYSIPCLLLIGLFSIAPLTTLIVALRSGAPDSPALAGAAGGLVAGSLAAAVYAMHCVEDSPLFLAVWYLLAISAITLFGAIIGRYALRW